MAALVIHAAALEFAEEVKEAVFIGGVTAQLLKQKRHVSKTLSFLHLEIPSFGYSLLLVFLTSMHSLSEEAETQYFDLLHSKHKPITSEVFQGHKRQCSSSDYVELYLDPRNICR